MGLIGPCNTIAVTNDQSMDAKPVIPNKNVSNMHRARVVAIVSVLATLPFVAVASEYTNQVSDADLLDRWYEAQDACRGGPDPADCDRRNNLTDALINRGYQQHRHDVWTSSEDAGTFYGVLRALDEEWANLDWFTRLLAAPKTMEILRDHISDEKIIAYWNGDRDFIRERHPHAFNALNPQIMQIAKDRPNDPRFMLDN